MRINQWIGVKPFANYLNYFIPLGLIECLGRELSSLYRLLQFLVIQISVDVSSFHCTKDSASFTSAEVAALALRSHFN